MQPADIDAAEERSSTERDVERALRREIRRRQRAERALRRQADAMQRTRRLLRGRPRWPEFVRALLRAITREDNVLWATFWSAEPNASGGVRKAVAFRDESIAAAVEPFAAGHPRAMRMLSRLYEELLQQHRGPIVLPADDPRVPRVVRKFYPRVGVVAVLQVPLFDDDGRLLGWISSLGRDVHPDPGLVAFVEALAEKAMLAFNLTAGADAMRALVLERNRQAHERELAEIHRRLHAGAMSPDQRLESVLAAVLRNAGGLLGARWGLLCRRDGPRELAPCAWLDGDTVESCASSDPRFEAGQFPGPYRHVLARWARASPLQRLPLRGFARGFVRTFSGLPAGEMAGASLRLVPLWFAGEATGLMVFVVRGDHEGVSAEVEIAVEALAIQAAVVLGWDAVARLERTAALTAERIRLARDLHDFLAQTFGGISLQLGAIAGEFPDLPERLQQRLSRVGDEASRGGEQLRRTLELLRPAPLELGSMAAALATLARRTHEVHGVPVRCECPPGDLGLSPDQEFHLFAIASEAVNNAVKHASGGVDLVLASPPRAWVLSVANALPARAPRRDGREGAGLRNMRERAGSLGATLRIVRRSGRVVVRVELRKAR